MSLLTRVEIALELLLCQSAIAATKLVRFRLTNKNFGHSLPSIDPLSVSLVDKHSSGERKVRGILNSKFR